MKLLFYMLFLSICITSCAIKGYENYPKISTDTNLRGTYIIQDSSSYANPNFMLSIKDSVDRTTCFGTFMHIDSIANKKLYGRYEKNGITENFIVQLTKSKRYIKIKRKHSARIYVLINFYGTNKSRIRISDEGDLLITKNNFGLGCIIIAPGFVASEYFAFIYLKH